jgi:hypothetical protein
LAEATNIQFEYIQNELLQIHQTLPKDEPPLKPDIALRTHELGIEESAGGWRHTALVTPGCVEDQPARFAY